MIANFRCLPGYKKIKSLHCVESSSTYSNYEVNEVFNYAAKEKHGEHFLNFLNEEDDFKTVAYLRVFHDAINKLSK